MSGPAKMRQKHVQYRRLANRPSFSSIKIAVTFLGLGLILVPISCSSGSIYSMFLYAWTSLGFLLGAYSYMGGKAQVFRKQKDGRLFMSTFFLLWPSLAVTWFTFYLGKLLSKEDPLNEILEGLYLGRRLGIGEDHLLTSADINGVVDLTCEFFEPAFVRNGRGYLNIPVLDGVSPSISQLEMGVAWIDHHLSLGPVYVHCAAGHGRGATLVVAFLIYSGVVGTPADAMDTLLKQRPKAKLTTQQRRNLEVFASNYS